MKCCKQTIAMAVTACAVASALGVNQSGALAVESSRDLAPAPPMGWNSYDSYGVYLHEKAAYANLEAMAEKLKPYGYEYFVIDNGWFGEYAAAGRDHLSGGKTRPRHQYQ